MRYNLDNILTVEEAKPIRLADFDPNAVSSSNSNQQLSQPPIGAPEGIAEAEIDLMNVASALHFSTTNKAKVTMDVGWLKFSAACVRFFPNTNHVLLIVDEVKRRLIVKPCEKYTIDALYWSYNKGTKLINRQITSKTFCAKIYDLMNWIPENKYRLMAVYQEQGDENIIIFNLEDSEMVVTNVNDIDGLKKTTRKIILPERLADSFGRTYREHKQLVIDMRETRYLQPNTDNTDGLSFSPEVEGKAPTLQETVSEQYTRKEKRRF